MNNVDNWVNKWAVEDSDQSYREINLQMNFFSKELYHDYEPIQGMATSFRTRLENWLTNITDESERKILFKTLPYIFYLGNKEFTTLYRVAYDELIASWIIDTDKISLIDFNQARDDLQTSIRNCWICPISDSLDINSFFHINNIPNNGWNERRPQWYGIGRPGDEASKHLWDSHKAYIEGNNISKLILIEDFVGSGSQIAESLEFVLNQKLDLDILVISLITCPQGIRNFTTIESTFDRFQFKSVLKPSKNYFVTRTRQYNEPEIFDEIRKLVRKSYLQVSGGIPEGAPKPYSPFGYKGTGGLIVMYTNTPDNTLPIIHWKSDSWEPVFPRHSRN